MNLLSLIESLTGEEYATRAILDWDELDLEIRNIENVFNFKSYQKFWLFHTCET